MFFFLHLHKLRKFMSNIMFLIYYIYFLLKDFTFLMVQSENEKPSLVLATLIFLLPLYNTCIVRKFCLNISL